MNAATAQKIFSDIDCLFEAVESGIDIVSVCERGKCVGLLMNFTSRRIATLALRR